MNGSEKSIQKSLMGLDIKLNEYKDDEEMVKLIKSAKRRIKIHKEGWKTTHLSNTFCDINKNNVKLS